MTRTGGRIRNVSAALLAGGDSRRMGDDKSRVVLGGVPLGARVAGVLGDIFEDVAWVGGEPPAFPSLRYVADGPGSPSALRGLVAALEAARAPRLVVVATDLALVTPALLLGLLAAPQADVVAPVNDEGPQPLCAIYRVDVALEVASRRLQAGRLSLRGLLEELASSWVEREDLASLDPTGQALSNLNTPDDVARAERWLASRDDR